MNFDNGKEAFVGERRIRRWNFKAKKMEQEKGNVLRDRYGFAVNTAFISLYHQFANSLASEEEERCEKWDSWISYIQAEGSLGIGLEEETDDATCADEAPLQLLERALSHYDATSRGTRDKRTRSGEPGTPKTAIVLQQLRSLVQMGVPMHKRAQFWKIFLNTESAVVTGEYEAFSNFVESVRNGDMSVLDNFDGPDGNTTKGEGSVAISMSPGDLMEWLIQIDKDLHRTFPDHPAMDEHGRDSLRRILGAFVVRNPDIGYCQGLNFLAAAFLLFFDEEDAYWCFIIMVEELLSGYFDPMMIAPQVDALSFSHVLKQENPTLASHLESLEVDIPTAISGWLLVAFMNTLPMETCLRVWDVLFFEKSPVVLFRVGLALVDIYSQALLETRENSDAYMLFQAMGPMSIDCGRLIDMACIGYSHVKDSALVTLRDKYAPSVTRMMENMYHVEANHPEITIPIGVPKAQLSRSGSIDAVSSQMRKMRHLADDDTTIQSPTKHRELERVDSPIGYLRLRQRAQIASRDEAQLDSGDTVRRAKSAVPATPLPEKSKREKLQQQTRINLLSMSTFIPDLKLPAVATAFRIATKANRVGSMTGLSLTPLKDSLDACCTRSAIQPSKIPWISEEKVLNSNKSKSVIELFREGQTLDLGSLKGAVKVLRFDDDSEQSKTQPDTSESPSISRRFTDGGAILGTRSGSKKYSNPQWAIPSHRASPLKSPQKFQLMTSLHHSEAKQLEDMAQSLEREVNTAKESLMEIESIEDKLEETANDLNRQLQKIQHEVEHKAVVLNVLYSRASDLLKESSKAEINYRKQLAINNDLVESWRKLSKETTLNAAILRDLMALASARPSSQPESPTKHFSNKVKQLALRKFTASYK